LSHLLPCINHEATIITHNLDIVEPIKKIEFRNWYKSKATSRGIKSKAILKTEFSAKSPQKLKCSAYMERLFIEENVCGNVVQ